MAVNKSSFFQKPTKEQKNKSSDQSPFGLDYLEPIESGPKKCLSRSPARPTYTPRGDGDIGSPDIDF